MQYFHLGALENVNYSKGPGIASEGFGSSEFHQSFGANTGLGFRVQGLAWALVVTCILKRPRTAGCKRTLRIHC